MDNFLTSLILCDEEVVKQGGEYSSKQSTSDIVILGRSIFDLGKAFGPGYFCTTTFYDQEKLTLVLQILSEYGAEHTYLTKWVDMVLYLSKNHEPEFYDDRFVIRFEINLTSGFEIFSNIVFALGTMLSEIRTELEINLDSEGGVVKASCEFRRL